jgi:hypothetical protein
MTIEPWKALNLYELSQKPVPARRTALNFALEVFYGPSLDFQAEARVHATTSLWPGEHVDLQVEVPAAASTFLRIDPGHFYTRQRRCGLSITKLSGPQSGTTWQLDFQQDILKTHQLTLEFHAPNLENREPKDAELQDAELQDAELQDAAPEASEISSDTYLVTGADSHFVIHNPFPDCEIRLRFRCQLLAGVSE